MRSIEHDYIKILKVSASQAILSLFSIRVNYKIVPGSIPTEGNFAECLCSSLRKPSLVTLQFCMIKGKTLISTGMLHVWKTISLCYLHKWWLKVEKIEPEVFTWYIISWKQTVPHMTRTFVFLLSFIIESKNLLTSCFRCDFRISYCITYM